MLHTNRNVVIAGTGSYAPHEVVQNENLTHSRNNPQWTKDTLGIERRHIVSANEATSDLATHAARAALMDAGIPPSEIDLIVVATSTPDRKNPSTACIVQHKLGITNTCPAFDIQAVCSGFIYALTIGSQFINSGQCKHVLVIGADCFSTITDWSKRDCVFFGDGAGAVVLKQVGPLRGFLSTQLYADGSGQDNFTVFPGDRTFTMNGKAVYETGTTVLPRAITSILKTHFISISDVDHVIPHQPSIKVLKKTAEILGIPFEKIHTNMNEYANTAGATIPLLLDQVNKAGNLKAGDLIVFAAVGSGWAWGAGICRWQKN